MELRIDVLHYWHVGTGGGRGGHVDAVVRRDALGLPLLPGRAINGLLRDAVERAEAWGWYGGDQQVALALFGSPPTRDPEAGVPQKRGVLRVGDARCPSVVREALGGVPAEQRAALLEPMYQDMHATALDEHGVARSGSLRGMEVSVPCTLRAELDVIAEPALPRPWREYLESALPLIEAVGAHRTRGYGRVQCALENT